MYNELIIIGSGPAALTAAIHAARGGRIRAIDNSRKKKLLIAKIHGKSAIVQGIM